MDVRESVKILMKKGLSRKYALTFLWKKMTEEEKKELSFNDLRAVYQVSFINPNFDKRRCFQIIKLLATKQKSLAEALWFFSQLKREQDSLKAFLERSSDVNWLLEAGQFDVSRIDQLIAIKQGVLSEIMSLLETSEDYETLFGFIEKEGAGEGSLRNELLEGYSAEDSIANQLMGLSRK